MLTGVSKKEGFELFFGRSYCLMTGLLMNDVSGVLFFKMLLCLLTSLMCVLALLLLILLKGVYTF